MKICYLARSGSIPKTHKLLTTGIFLSLLVSLIIPVSCSSDYDLTFDWVTPSNSRQEVGEMFILSVSANFTLNKWMDESGAGNDGQINGAEMVRGLGDESRWALIFDGSDDYVDCGNNPSLNITGAITIMAWVKPASKTTPGTIASKENYANASGWMLFQMLGVDWYFRIYNGTTSNAVSLANSVTLDKWQHIVATYDKQYLRLYKNGEQIATSVAWNWSIATTEEHLWLGARSTVGQHFNGSISEVRIYNRALNETEIRFSYEHNTPMNSSAQVLDLTFKKLSWALERSEDGLNFVEVKRQNFAASTIKWSEEQAGKYYYRGKFLGDDYYTEVQYTAVCSVDVIQSNAFGLSDNLAKLTAIFFAISVFLLSIPLIGPKKKKV